MEKEDVVICKGGKPPLPWYSKTWSLHSHDPNPYDNRRDEVVLTHCVSNNPSQFTNSKNDKESVDSGLQLILIESLDDVKQ